MAQFQRFTQRGNAFVLIAGIKPRTRIELPEFHQRVFAHQAGPVGRLVEGRVVPDHELTVGRCPHVDLDSSHTGLHSQTDGSKRVGRTLRLRALMSDRLSDTSCCRRKIRNEWSASFVPPPPHFPARMFSSRDDVRTVVTIEIGNEDVIGTAPVVLQDVSLPVTLTIFEPCHASRMPP